MVSQTEVLISQGVVRYFGKTRYRRKLLATLGKMVSQAEVLISQGVVPFFVLIVFKPRLSITLVLRI